MPIFVLLAEKARPSETAFVARRLRATTPGSFRSPDGRTVRIDPRRLVPVIDDTETAALRRRWLGKRVYAYGGFSLTSPGGDGGVNATIDPIHGGVVKDILRFRSRRTVYFGRLTDNSESEIVDAPILVRFILPKGDRPYSGTGHGAESRMIRPVSDSAWSAEFANADHFQRHFSLVPPDKTARQAIYGTVRPGMTRAQVLWGLGWPAMKVPASKLRRLSSWYYGAPTPFDSTVEFRGDRVIRYNPPGRLP